MDATLAVALLAVISSVFVPMLTALINNHYQMKLKKLELLEIRRLEMIEDYLKGTNEFINSRNGHYEQEFSRVSGKVYLYAPQQLWPQLDELHECLILKNVDRDFDRAKELFSNLRKDLSKHTSARK